MAGKIRTNMTVRLLSRLALVLIFCVSGSATAQESRSTAIARNYGFVSPNTREDLKFEDAVRGLSSSEETNLMRRAKNLGCVVKRQIRTLRALGSWSDGAEPSVLLRVNSDESTLRYLMSRLGRDANQKAVIYFHPLPAGPAQIHIVRPARRFRAFKTIARALDSAGIAFRTLVPTKETTVVYIVDTDNNLANKVRDAARRLRARFSSHRGNASFIGDDSVREKGQAVFAEEIKSYETKNPSLPPPCAN